MTVEVLSTTAAALQSLAKEEGRDLDALVEEALQNYLCAAGMTDLESEEIAGVQMALLPELADFSQ